MGTRKDALYSIHGEDKMSNIEKKTYIGGAVFAVAFITASALVLNIPARAQSANLGAYDEFQDVGGEILVESTEWAKTGQIRSNSGMPCENSEQFERWYATYEQETGEEEAEKPNINTDCCEDVQTEIPTELPTEVETTVEVPSEPVEETVAVYSVNGETLNPELQAYLYQRLADHHIEWFMPYAVMICYQESHFDQYNVSDDGLDYGLLQFRKQFWDWSRGDIFDPYAQIDVFVELMANRANSGCDVYEMISRHMQSDYGSYNHDYVATVLSHERGLSIIGN